MVRCSGWMSALVLLAGCSSGIDSGVEGGKPVSTLDEPESMALCVAVVDYLTATFPEGYSEERNCTIRALSMTATPEDCEAMRAACLADPPPDGLFDFGDIDCDTTGPIPDCDASVDSVEACYTADIEVYRSRLDELDCSIAGNLPVLMELMEPPAVPSECAEAGAMACPELSDGLIPRGD
jgi:hypothetical protein